MSFEHTSVIVTTSAVDTRTRDQLSYPITFRPQAMTIYVRFLMLTIDAGTVGNRAIVQIGSNSTTNPRLLVDFLAASWRIILLNGINSVNSTVSNGGLTVGDRIELLGTVQSTGIVQIAWSRNEGAQVTGTASGALLLPQAWTNNVIFINSVATTSVGFCAYRNIEIQAGVHTMQEMRLRAGV